VLSGQLVEPTLDIFPGIAIALLDLPDEHVVVAGDLVEIVVAEMLPRKTRRAWTGRPALRVRKSSVLGTF